MRARRPVSRLKILSDGVLPLVVSRRRESGVDGALSVGDSLYSRADDGERLSGLIDGDVGGE